MSLFKSAASALRHGSSLWASPRLAMPLLSSSPERPYSSGEDQPPGTPENMAPAAINPDTAAKQTLAEWPLEDGPGKHAGPQAADEGGVEAPRGTLNAATIQHGGIGTPLQAQRASRYVDGDSSEMVDPGRVREGKTNVVEDDERNTINAPGEASGG